MRTTLRRIEDMTPHIRTYWFEPVSRFGYIAGQFVEITIPHDNPDVRGSYRWFTLSSSPTEPLLGITTRFSEPSSSFKQAFHALKVGTEVNFSEPMGDFVLPKDQSIPLVFVAGGMGVTPCRSMAKWLQDTGEKRQLEVILAVNQQEDILYQDIFRTLGCEPTIVITNPPTKWRGVTGHLTAEKLVELVGNDRLKRMYLSGPETMVESLTDCLQLLGYDSDQLVGDYFPGYQPI